MKKRKLMRKDSGLDAAQLPPTDELQNMNRGDIQMRDVGKDGEQMMEPCRNTVAELIQLLAEKKNEIKALRTEIRELKRHATSRAKWSHCSDVAPGEADHQSQEVCSTATEGLESVESELAAVIREVVSVEAAVEHARIECAAVQKALAAAESDLKEKEIALVIAREANEWALQDRRESAANFSKQLTCAPFMVRQIHQ